jgi:putative endonuclease
MAYLYILQSLKNFRYYIGSTNNIDRRLDEHNSGKSKYTKIIRPLKLVFKQEYPSIMLARKIEHKLKKLKSKEIIEKIIEDKYIKLGP